MRSIQTVMLQTAARLCLSHEKPPLGLGPGGGSTGFGQLDEI